MESREKRRIPGGGTPRVMTTEFTAHPFLTLVGFQIAVGVLIALSFAASFSLALAAFAAVLAVWCLGIWLLERNRAEWRASHGDRE